MRAFLPDTFHYCSRLGLLLALLFVVLPAGCVGSPSASFTATPDSGQAPLVVRFDASASSGSIDVYRWDFGDGAVEETTVATVQHQYDSPQRYEVTLTVEGGGGVGRAVDSVVVDNPPQPDSPLGFYAIEFDNAGLPAVSGRSGSIKTQSDVTVQVVDGPLVSDQITIAPTGSRRSLSTESIIYMNVDFVLTNGTEEVLENLVLLGYNRPEFREGSAISQPLNDLGTPTPADVLRQIKPTHYFDLQEGGFTVSATRADFAALAESDVPDLSTAYPFVTTVFPYGFVVRDDDFFSSRTIAPSEQGKFTLSFVLPVLGTPEENIDRFIWNAILVREDIVRTTQAPNERWEATTERAHQVGAERIVAIGGGNRTTPSDLCSALVSLDNVRIAGIDRNDSNYNALLASGGVPNFSGCPTQ